MFEAGPGVPSNVPTRLIDASDGTNPHENVFINGGTNALTAIGDTASAENNIPLGSPLEGNTQNYPGAENNHYHFQLSFLDKGPTLIANIDKDNELFDGIGEKGLVLVPEFLEGDIKKNIEFYLRKAGIIEKRTIKAPPRPERGR